MYQYTEFDRQFVKARASQFRDQLTRWQAGELAEDEFKPLRLQNGWYVQRYAPMLRVAVPYGELASRQMRVLAKIAREYDQPDAALLADAQATQDKLGAVPLRNGLSVHTKLTKGYAHFTTRTNVQYNWIPLSQAADVMDLLASVDMHGIQTSGNCIRNITSDALAGIAPDEIADPRPFAEIMRQWSTLHPEFAFLPRKFKIALNGALEDRAAIGWYDVGLQLLRSETGELGFRVQVGGGMGRTPLIGSVIREFLPWNQIMNYIEAVIRVYNRYGRRDNVWKARIKILVKAEGQRYIDQVEAEFKQIVEQDGAPHLITQEEYDRVAACFLPPVVTPRERAPAEQAENEALRSQAQGNLEYARWLERNVRPHQNPELRAVSLSFKRPNIGLLTDMITCPGGDFCSLANARSIPIAEAITERYQDLDELHDLGEIDLHISGCINSCGHHHSGHIGILGVDKDGKEWYQVSLGGADGSLLSGPAMPGKTVGPSFSAAEVPEVVEAVLDTYRQQRNGRETFIDTLRRVGPDAFKAAANAARLSTQRSEPAESVVA